MVFFFQFPFLSIRGVSSDDSNLYFSKLFKSVIKKFNISTDNMILKESRLLLDYLSYTSTFIGYFFLNLFSSLPSPLFDHSIRNHYDMNFSPYGNASISIQLYNKDFVFIKASARYEFIYQYPVYIFITVLSLWYSDQLSKSKIFQYCCGIISSVTFGLILILLSLIGTIKPK